MDRIKVGTVLSRSLYEELQAASRRTGRALSELLEEGMVLVLRQQAVARLKEIGDRHGHRAGAALRILRSSRADLAARAVAEPERKVLRKRRPRRVIPR